MARRFKFSFRTMVVAVTLFCAYLAAWEATNRHAESQIGVGYVLNGEEIDIGDASAPAPFLVWQYEFINNSAFWDRYYAWLFGFKVKVWETMED